MMRPFVVHELIKFFARIVAAKAAKINTFFFSATSELTLLYIIIDIVTATAATIHRPTRSTKKPTGPVLRLLHLIILLQ